MKKLIPALCLLLISAILMGTSTYAWFSMNTQVTATGMQVKAVAESGLLINYVTTVGDSGWSNSSDTTSPAINLTPASTATITGNWFHNHSNSSSNAVDYVTDTWTALSITPATTPAAAGTNGARTLGTFVDGVSGDTLNAYVKYIYYIKSSSASAISIGGESDTYKELDIDKITITGQNADGLDLCKSLRVGVVLGSTVKIFAPFAGATGSYTVGGATSYSVDAVGTLTTTVTEFAANTDLMTTGSIPAVTSSSPTEVDIYVWFEGEDANCKSDNTEVLNNLSISVSFNLETTAD